MPDTPVFDSEYDQPSKTELPSSPVASPSKAPSVVDTESQGSSTEPATPQLSSSDEENIDIVVENDPRDVLRTVDTGRPYRDIREWTITNG